MTTDAEDRSTWPRNGQVIRRAELLRLIEENGGPEGLDLRGAIFVGDGEGGGALENPIDLTPEGLAPLARAYRQANGGTEPPWLTENLAMNLSFAWLREADFRRAQLRGASLVVADLQDTAFVRADLRGANLGAARSHGCDFTLALLQMTSLASAVSDADEGTLHGASWYGATLDNTRIKRGSLGGRTGDEIRAHRDCNSDKYHAAKEAYLALKNNFNQIGRYEDASWAYVKEQQMEKMAFYWEWRRKRRTPRWEYHHGWRLHRRPVWWAWGSFWRWLRNWAYELATGYGERPWNPVMGGILIMLGFAGGFTGAVGNFWDALIYSLATFATFNLADTGPTGRGADVASSAEALLGIAVLALVVFTLGNKMSRG